jgi:aromatic ring-opening dioxygenase catalytic subunit (LigB family)
MQQQGKVLFISHGGGPLPLLGDIHHQEMITTLKEIVATIPKPDAIIVVSAHWEEERVVITSNPKPALIYDYSGFPTESYSIEYPCLGAPALAEEIEALMRSAGINTKLNSQRGLDHGAFVPLKIMYPGADIPCVQVSLLDSLDPQKHIEIGKALSPLLEKNVLIIGSGFSFHNMPAFFSKGTENTNLLNLQFEAWLNDTCCNTDYDENEREQRLINWEKAPGARFCQPREEHLMPLHVCYGAAQKLCSASFPVTILNKLSSQFLWL